LISYPENGFRDKKDRKLSLFNGGGGILGVILSSKREDDKMKLELVTDYSELAHLRGEMDCVHIFTEKVAQIRTEISSRGKNSATKYFLIPRLMRTDLKFHGGVSCQRINTGNKAIFIYVVDRVLKQVG
jgi:hypothetical protein